MKRQLKATALSLALVSGIAAGAEAKTLVYCSEGSPEGFNPSLYSAGTTFDASAQAIYNRTWNSSPAPQTLFPDWRNHGLHLKMVWSTPSIFARA